MPRRTTGRERLNPKLKALDSANPLDQPGNCAKRHRRQKIPSKACDNVRQQLQLLRPHSGLSKLLQSTNFDILQDTVNSQPELLVQNCRMAATGQDCTHRDPIELCRVGKSSNPNTKAGTTRTSGENFPQHTSKPKFAKYVKGYLYVQHTVHAHKLKFFMPPPQLHPLLYPCHVPARGITPCALKNQQGPSCRHTTAVNPRSGQP